MFNRLKSLPLTILLTILIWMYAESQFTATQEGLTLTLQVASPNADYSVRLVDPTDSKPRSALPLSLTVQGSQSVVERLRQQLLGLIAPDEDLANLAFVPPVTVLRPDSDKSVDTVTVLNRLSYFRNKGITIIGASPARLRLDVSRLQKITRPVTFRPPLDVLVESPVITPDRAEVTVPQKMIEAIGSEERISVVAVPIRDLATLPPDVLQTMPARLVIEYPGPKDERISVTPQQVNVTLRLPRQREDTLVVPGVPIWVAGPPALLGRYDVDLQPRIVQLTVTGTPAVLTTLRNTLASGARGAVDTGIRAYVDVTLNDRPQPAAESRPLRYVLPEGVQLREGPKNVDLRLVDNLTTQPASTPN